MYAFQERTEAISRWHGHLLGDSFDAAAGLGEIPYIRSPRFTRTIVLAVTFAG